jgi:hypothetical protein
VRHRVVAGRAGHARVTELPGHTPETRTAERAVGVAEEQRVQPWDHGADRGQFQLVDVGRGEIGQQDAVPGGVQSLAQPAELGRRAARHRGREPVELQPVFGPEQEIRQRRVCVVGPEAKVARLIDDVGMVWIAGERRQLRVDDLAKLLSVGQGLQTLADGMLGVGSVPAPNTRAGVVGDEWVDTASTVGRPTSVTT